MIIQNWKKIPHFPCNTNANYKWRAHAFKISPFLTFCVALSSTLLPSNNMNSDAVWDKDTLRFLKDLLMLIYTKLYWKWCCYFVLRRVRASNNSFTYEMSHSFSDLHNQGSRSEANEDNNRNNEGCGWWREHHQNWWPWYWCCKWSAHHHYDGGTSELSCWSNCCNFCLKQKNVWAHGRLIEGC